MPLNPRILINLPKLTANARRLVEICSPAGIGVIGVTKAVCGDPNVAEAMLRGGVHGLADARVENIRRLRNAGVTAMIMLLRSPMLSEIEDVVRLCDISLNSELAVIEKLSACACRQGKIHHIIIMVDVGEIREGILPENIAKFGKRVRDLQGIKVVGVGTNLSCYSGVLPTVENMGVLLSAAAEMESELGHKLPIISGGNSSGLCLVKSGQHPRGINQLRLGESILLGRFVPDGEPIEGTHQDVFSLVAELIELKEKSSTPTGEIGKNAFGDYAQEAETRLHYRGILALGRQDVPPDSLCPITEGLDRDIKVIGATSDHTVIDFGADKGRFRVGDELRFELSYPGLLAALTSQYVYREYRY